jgi:23S rRNA pseudouridine1911/1915/1917 synthase
MPSGDATVFLVEPARPAQRLDAYLRARLSPLSRGAVQRLITQGHVLVDGRPAKPSQVPRAGQRIVVHWPAPQPSPTTPQAIALDILFEDADLVVLNKPPGLVVHPSVGHREGTLVNALLHHCRGQLSGIGGVARPGIVHRLDKDTSGCLIAAKNDPAHLALATQFSSRTVQKLYHALVCGVVNPPQGDIRAAIARHPTHRKRMAVTDGRGRDAWTSYQLLDAWPAAALVQATLHTGRTHQIRVHFKHLGCPLVGDVTYGKRQNQRLAALTGYTAPRQMLHARQLTFLHPQRGLRITCEAPWPPDFAEAVRTLGAAPPVSPDG